MPRYYRRNSDEGLRNAERVFLATRDDTSYARYVAECSRSGVNPSYCRCGNNAVGQCSICRVWYCGQTCGEVCGGQVDALVSDGETTFPCTNVICQKCNPHCVICDVVSCINQRCSNYTQIAECHNCASMACVPDTGTDCTFTCNTCENITCRNCEFHCDRCNEYYCRKCLTDCGLCRKPHIACPGDDCVCAQDGCGEGICPNCIERAGECHICEHLYCEEHARYCPICDHGMCEEHTRTCQIREGGRECGREVCRECLRQCSSCSDLYGCEEHVVECIACSEYVCAACKVTCNGCEETFCEDCADDVYTGSQCSECSQFFCNDCQDDHKHQETQKKYKIGDKVFRRLDRMQGEIVKIIEKDDVIKVAVYWNDETIGIYEIDKITDKRRRLY